MSELTHVVGFMNEVKKEPHRFPKLVPNTEDDKRGNIKNTQIQQRVTFKNENLTSGEFNFVHYCF